MTERELFIFQKEAVQHTFIVPPAPARRGPDSGQMVLVMEQDKAARRVKDACGSRSDRKPALT
jgi:hypothetical protein